ncbi:MAG: aspartate--tRNA ligase [Planctomycetota bacterium]|jgi:aspartyl-tRNA synthetase
MWKLKRTHNCGELRDSDAGKEVVVNGWVDTIRDHGGLLFVNLRDRYGRTQVLFRQDDRGLQEAASAVKPEWVLAVRGTVRKRSKENLNPDMPTGGIEVEAAELEVLNEAKTPPFEIVDGVKVSEELRFKHRYLDLRRPAVQGNFLARDRMVQAIRESMSAQGFVDIETPSMVKYTPGGARNFLVPSRLFPGRFFALPESPQIFKQLYMIAGFDRYYQIVKCWRDEDMRADRQPEFTQLDVEMSFVEQDDVLGATEECMRNVWKRVLDVAVAAPFPRMTYDEAIRDYGTDKPDLRFGMMIVDVSDAVKDCGFKVFSGTVASGGVVRGLRVEGGAKFSRKEIDALETHVKGVGAKGLVALKAEEGKLSGGGAKFLKPDEQKGLISAMRANAGDLLLFIADEEGNAASYLGGLRIVLRDKLGLVKPGEFRFCWVVDFPMFEKSEEGEWVAKHHPFTMPREEDLDRLETDQGKVKANAYDLVVNGVELGGGSIRIHRKEIQSRVFKALGFSEEYARDRFSFLLEAFEYGAPPHGGIALGIDRIAMILLGADNIREVIAFPKTMKTVCFLTGAPTPVLDKQLEELHVRTVPPAKRDG